MFLMELFEDDESLGPQRVTLDDLHGVPEKALGILTRLARFHQVQNLSFNRRDRVWTATDSEGLQPFIVDAKHVTSAAGMGSRMTAESTTANTMYARPLVKEEISDYCKQLGAQLKEDGVSHWRDSDWRGLRFSVTQLANPTITESSHPAFNSSKKFIERFNQLDQFSKLNIAVGSKVSIIMLTMSFDRAELSGFSAPKTITKIYREPTEQTITQFEFNNDPSDVWPRQELATYDGQFIVHSAFFGNKQDADQAVTMLLLGADSELTVSNDVIAEDTGQLPEGTGYTIDRTDRDEFSPEDIEKIKNAPFPDMARSNLRVKRKQDKARAQRATWSDNGGGESNLGSPIGSSSSNDY